MQGCITIKLRSRSILPIKFPYGENSRMEKILEGSPHTDENLIMEILIGNDGLEILRR